MRDTDLNILVNYISNLSATDLFILSTRVLRGTGVNNDKMKLFAMTLMLTAQQIGVGESDPPAPKLVASEPMLDTRKRYDT